MNRKDFLKTSSRSLIAVSLIGLFSSNCKDDKSFDGEDHSHHHHNHEKMDGSKNSTELLTGKYSQAIRSASDCIVLSKKCLTHCLEEMGKGDTSLQSCALATRETISLCNSFIDLASQDSKFLKELTGLCIKVCENCAKECKKHADHHEICKECMEACLDCVREMKKIA